MPEVAGVWAKLGELAAVVGMIDAIANSERRRQLRGGWQERLDEIVQFADRQIDEIIEFGEAYD
jgi:hypothetical protein